MQISTLLVVKYRKHYQSNNFNYLKKSSKTIQTRLKLKGGVILLSYFRNKHYENNY